METDTLLLRGPRPDRGAGPDRGGGGAAGGAPPGPAARREARCAPARPATASCGSTRASTRSCSLSRTRPRARAGSRSSCPLPGPRAACSSSSGPAIPDHSGRAPLSRERVVLRVRRRRPRGARVALPKGLLPFHRYPEGARTPFEEHLVEAAATVRDAAGVCRVHVTVSPEHRTAFEAVLEQARPRLERETGARFEVRFSEQSPSTDTVAIDETGPPLPGFGGAAPLPAGRARRSPEEPRGVAGATSSS